MKFFDYNVIPIDEYKEPILANILCIKSYLGKERCKDFLNFAKSEDTATQIEAHEGHKLHFFPTNKIRIPVDKNVVIKNKAVAAKYNDSIVTNIDLDLSGGALYKNRLIMFDVFVNNNWKRPIYFTGGAFEDEDYLWMKDYLQLDGMVFKLVPIKTKYDEENAGPSDMGQIDTDKMYNIVMKWDWGNGESTKIYHDPSTRQNCISYRNNMARLAQQLIKEGKNAKAEKIIDLALAKMPLDYYGYYTLLDSFADGYYKLGKKQKAQDLLSKIMNKYREELIYYKGFKQNDMLFLRRDIQTAMFRYMSLTKVAKDNKDTNFSDKHEKEFESICRGLERFAIDME